MKKILYSLAFALLLLPAGAMAAQFRSSDSVVEVKKTDVSKNLYLAGQSVTVNGDVSKDLYAAGSTVEINGATENSVVAIGSTVTLSGNAGENVKLAGSTVSVNSKVGGDLMMAGSVVKLDKDAIVSGDLLVAGASVNIAGTVNGNVTLSGSEITISGKILGDVKISDVTNLVITSTANIAGKLDYSSPSEASVDSAAKVAGGVKFNQVDTKGNDPMDTGSSSWAAFSFTGWLMEVLAMIVALLIMVYLLPKTSKDLVESNSTTFWGNVGRGFATLILAPAVVLAFFLSFVAIAAGFAVGFAYLAILIVSYGVIGLALGAWTQRVILKKSSAPLDWKTALWGGITLGVVELIPLVGPIMIVILYLAGLGSVIKLAGATIASNRK